jgi:tetratricopeptide (TPR) repeat protein
MKNISLIFLCCATFFSSVLSGQVSENLKQVNLYLEKGNWQEAWRASAKLQGKSGKKQICNGDPVIRLLHGHTSLAAGNYDEAMTQFYCDCDSLNSESLMKWRTFCQGLVSDNPGFSSAHYLLGDALARLENYDSAKVEFTKAIELSTNNFLALNARGVNQWILSKSKNETMCLLCTADWDSAVLLKPDMADAIVNKGVSFLLVGGDEERCISLFQRAIESKSDFSLAHNGIKVAYHAQGNVEGFFDVAPNAKNAPFSRLDTIVHSLDSIAEARGFGTLAMCIPTPATIAIGAIAYSAGAGIEIGNNIDRVLNSTPTTINDNQQRLADNLKGGVYSIQIEGINKKTFQEGFPSVSGTWFLLNYPSKIWKIK